ncbi:MAG: hypothetical protein JXB13_11245 [Phycisphaerae bacterium]|nr:hypothetical protein [Phycisphaerae bacterium]
MSTIGSVGGSGSDLIQMLQRLAGQSESPQEFAVGGSPPQGGPPPGGPPEDCASMVTDQVASFAEAEGLDSETVSSLQEQLASAISAALEESDGSTDPRELIDGAILSTLEEYGLDGEAFLSELKGSMPAPPNAGEMGRGSTDSDIMSQMLSSLTGSTDTAGPSTQVSLLDIIA